ncbi:M15 family metallopeptidase [Lysinibacillus sp. SGAir0095]|uniref:M15 family metallopeptidase n=1 Tax=Lysinibacillus sp. SGAir0095 TaxID=2070463 RepID=UPI0010CD4F08|nr:M15 family metallopeptidase [Lysinibacillus sp. SGAir0095]QCR33067.1 D-alanyl-D-alanine dipeptidase [Lysinibacillus sp. SGAir0095]
MYYEQGIPDSLKSIYIRKNTYERLIEALNLLPQNYSFILYDGYRPLQVQQYLFQLFSQVIKKRNPYFSEEDVLKETLKFVAFPSIEPYKTSPHLTGGALDLTLGDLAGNPLDLGSAFDEMSKKSATCYYEQYPNENEEALRNRRILFHAMTAVGFTNYSEEWWHYDYGNVTWARRVNATEAKYGAIEAIIETNQIKEFRYL